MSTTLGAKQIASIIMEKTMFLEGAMMSSTIEGHFETTAPSMENSGSARSYK